jgi:toxin ParE2
VTIRFLGVAQAELDEAVDWYKALSPDLGDAFLIEAIRVFRLIEQYPKAWHPMGENIRRCRLARFPYGIIYTEDGGDRLIVAVVHMHRAPRYWCDRLAPDLGRSDK